ncbi:SH3 domain-containing protein [Streptomyces albipurpureus]|uniref:SH3 domain-containing protein n=1 Tax=Streptomyces albipurpureus TaxID=2897419 RepID=A0ABT0UJJ4_9ACTN|nr:SH3 domain-containing protein [Streptomyces sp. CWNU-1]MCM2388819.1 SH3 domain-containing protein [Streptomyces sp. CWNU-1]
MNVPLRRAIAVGASTALLAMGAVALAPSASAAGASSCTYNLTDHNAVVDGAGINYRTGPATSHRPRGMLYDGDDLRVYCGKGVWYYSKLIVRSGGGLPKGTYGWIRKDMLLELV